MALQPARQTIIGAQLAPFVSMGAGIALHLAIRHPQLVRKLAVASVTYNNEGFHPGLLAGLENLKAEYLTGTPWQQEYARIAPKPQDYPAMVEKVRQMNMQVPDLDAEVIRSIKAPTLIIVGDSDIIRPEHAVEMFRLLGGGVIGDTTGIPPSRLAVLPGTAHSTLTNDAELLVPIITRFLDEPMPEDR